MPRPVVSTALILVLVLSMAPPAHAEPQSDWVDAVHGYCAIDTHRIPPGHPDYQPGTPAFDAAYDVWGDPRPGTAEWDAQMEEKQRCNVQRKDYDRQHHPAWLEQSARVGQDFYRDPDRHDGTRFRHVDLPAFTVPLVPSAEVFLPCPTDESVCPDLPDGLERFDPPYPVVLVLHGLSAAKELHRFNTQAFAEAGYMAIGVNGVPGVGPFGPNFQRCGNIDSMYEWLDTGDPVRGHTELSAELGGMADFDRFALAGHSQGSLCAMGYQDDPRFHTIISWDNTDDADASTPFPKPIMYQRTDGGSGSTTSMPFDELPDPEGRAEGYTKLRELGIDVMHLTFRATTHVTWNGNGVALDGNRLGELLINYYNLAWLDRHLRGRLVLDGDGVVVPTHGRTEAEERRFRQEVATDAFHRLTADAYDDSSDRHNISAGWYDPVQAEASGDLRYGGNVPYAIEGFPIDGLLSRYHRSRCFLSLPDYVNGATGAPGAVDDPILARADTTAGYSMRHIGCPVAGLPTQVAPGVPLPPPGLEGQSADLGVTPDTALPDDPVRAAITIAQQRFPLDDAAQSPRRPSGVVLARADQFADALAGSVLLGDAPLLFTDPQSLHPDTAAEIDRLLADGGSVVMLGGDGALAPAIADGLTADGYEVTRLAGPSRVETAIAVADHVMAGDTDGPDTVVLTRADAPANHPSAAWVDAVTAGGWAAETSSPVLLTPSEATHPAVQHWLAEHSVEVVALGGTDAVSDAVLHEAGARRVGGGNRYATAVAVAEEMWTAPPRGRLVLNGTRHDAWAFALAAAGLAADGNRPMVLVDVDGVPAETDGHLCADGPRRPGVPVGSLDLINPVVREALAGPCA